MHYIFVGPRIVQDAAGKILYHCWLSNLIISAFETAVSIYSMDYPYFTALIGLLGARSKTGVRIWTWREIIAELVKQDFYVNAERRYWKKRQ